MEQMNSICSAMDSPESDSMGIPQESNIYATVSSIGG